MSKVIVIGGGAAGMMAAYSARLCGHEVVLLEHNEKLGKKLYITGKGRCNFTNASDMDVVMKSVVSNPKFLYSAFYTFDNQAVMDLLEAEGLAYKVERGNRVFPVSDHSSDVIRTLERLLKRYDVEIRLHTEVAHLLISDHRVEGVVLSNGKKIISDAVVIACGGKSYETTGSTGDGYRLAKEAGHSVTKLYPALVPLVTREDYIPLMQGLSLKNVSLQIKQNNKVLYEDFGEMMFTHFGITGPLVLSASSVVSKLLPGELSATIDLKPALSKKQLDERILREIKENPKAHVKSLYQKLLPSKMISVMMNLVDVDETKQLAELSKEERMRIVDLLKAFPMTITATRSFKEAIITQGGVNVKEVDSSTMESKLCKRLFFAGEVLDLDATTGGFNLQIAWSTGYLAGCSIQ